MVDLCKSKNCQKPTKFCFNKHIPTKSNDLNQLSKTTESQFNPLLKKSFDKYGRPINRKFTLNME